MKVVYEGEKVADFDEQTRKLSNNTSPRLAALATKLEEDGITGFTKPTGDETSAQLGDIAETVAYADASALDLLCAFGAEGFEILPDESRKISEGRRFTFEVPYESEDAVPKYVPKEKRKQWMDVYNAAYATALDEDLTPEQARETAQSQADAVAGPEAKPETETTKPRLKVPE